MWPSRTWHAGAFDRVEGVEEEVVAPHHGLIDAEALALVIGGVLEDPLPRVVGEKVVLAQADQDADRVVGVPTGAGVLDQSGQLPQAARSDGGGRTLVWKHGLGFVPVVRRDEAVAGPRQEEVRASARGVEKAPVSGVAVGGAEAGDRPRLAACPGTVVAPALLRGLPQELAAPEVEDTFVGSTPVAAHAHA